MLILIIVQIILHYIKKNYEQLLNIFNYKYICKQIVNK